ncbi:MAG TPA: SPFH domain-containing protein [Candidatus Babeliales bacterium]|nr:SPFH domain-containing protein [Candidatus Babeliales bacterium]
MTYVLMSRIYTVIYLSVLLLAQQSSYAMQQTKQATRTAMSQASGRRNISWGCFYLVPQQKRIVLERLGKFEKVLGPGLHFKLPVIQAARQIEVSRAISGGREIKMVSHIDLREQMHYIPSQKVITQDNVAMTIDGRLYAAIEDPEKVAYGIQDVNVALESLAQTTLRNVIGGMKLDTTLNSRDTINRKLQQELAAAAARWGVRIQHVELQQILPPAEIQHAMESQMKAERDQRAAVLIAEGEKKAAVLRAEGYREASIKEAEGRNQATILDAEAQAKARYALAEAESRSIQIVQSAAPKQNALAYLIATKYITELPKVTEGKAGKTVVVPYDATSLAGATSMIKDFFRPMSAE